MPDATFDAIIVGGGNKALFTAIYLAKYGKMKVGQVEVATVIGLVTLGITLALVLLERVLRRGGSAQTVT